MRITGYGSGSGNFGSPRDRRKAFKRSHSIGQRVVGAFMGWQDENLAWVEIDGQPLLARLDADPNPGQRFLFVVKQLDPEIMLQVLTPKGGGGQALAMLAQEYWGERVGFEVAFKPLADELQKIPEPEARKDVFNQHLQQDAKAGQAYARLHSAVRHVNSWLSSYKKGRMWLAPWLLPAARELEILVVSGSEKGVTLNELTASFALPKLGHCELRMLLRPPEARYRLSMERPWLAPQLQACLKGLDLPGTNLTLESGGVGSLTPGPRTVLAAFLQEESQTYLPRFSLHV